MRISTGYKELDRMLGGGFKEGCLYVIGGRPSMGKTALALNMIHHICLTKKQSAVLYSLELPYEQLIRRLISISGHLCGTEENGESSLLSPEEMRQFITIDDTSGISVAEIRDKSINYKAGNNISAIFIDYLQLAVGSGEETSREQEICNIMQGLKTLAKALNIPIIVLSQLSRDVEARDDHRPVIEDLSAPDISQTADVVMFLYRDGYYYTDSDEPDIAEVIVAKNLTGECGTCKLAYNCETVTCFDCPDDRRRVPIGKSKYSFDGFKQSEGNKQAFTAAMEVAKNPGEFFNPLYIYGDYGTGKTYLLYAISDYIMKNRQDINIVHVSADHFMEDVITGIRSGDYSFREKYRKAGMLLFDDIQLIAGKEATQEEFRQVFNCLFEAGKQIVITGNESPKELVQKGLLENLASRLEWGSCVEIKSYKVANHECI